MPVPPPIPSRSIWTVEDLEQLPEDGNRYEILHGELLVTPMPTLWHQRIASRLIGSLSQLCGERRGWECFAPGGVFMGETSFLLPDLVVFAMPTGLVPDDWRDLQPPALVIEILSPSTTKRDRHRKRPAYLAYGVAEVWLVDIDTHTFERFTAQSEFPQLHTNMIAWSPSEAVPALTIEFNTLFAPA